MGKKLTKLAVKKPRAKKAMCKSTASRKANRGSPLRRHFEKAGVCFDLTQDEILAQIKTLMGRKRHAEWRNASIAHHEGWGSPEAKYQTLRSAEEINTLFSLQSHVSLQVCGWLAEQVVNSGLKQGRIGDLGCSSGVLAGWLASKHPGCKVIGWDAMANLVEAASSSQTARNLSFATWDYAQTLCSEPNSCDILATCFGVDFPVSREVHPQAFGMSLRMGEYYQKMRRVIRPYFRGWRTAIKDQGHLYAVLRISCKTFFLATVDAAHDEGWQLAMQPYEYLDCGVEHFPAMTFQAVSAPPYSEQMLLSLWCRKDFRAAFATELKDDAATCAFKSLRTKTILKTKSQTYFDYTMDAVVGTAGYLGFQYTHNAEGFARLKLMSLDEAETVEPWFPPPAPFEFLC